MLNIIKYVDEQVISQDFLNDKTPSIFDSKAGLSISNKLIKLIAWYDNEIGYSNKLLDLIVFINKWRNN